MHQNPTALAKTTGLHWRVISGTTCAVSFIVKPCRGKVAGKKKLPIPLLTLVAYAHKLTDSPLNAGASDVV